MQTPDINRTIEAVWRIESARLTGALLRMVRDVGLAEELAQDALVAAMERWPRSGVPDNPAGWLMATAKNRAIDRLRRSKRLEEKVQELGRELAGAGDDPAQHTAPDEVKDDLLRLIFTACHPILSPEGRVALTLRLVGGLSTEEIARAFLVSDPTVAQRIVRAKRTLAAGDISLDVPSGSELSERLASVLSVIYLIFNEGYAATSGDRWVRIELCEEAMRLGRILAELASSEPEVHGLIALMEIQASRLRARTGPSGEPVLLLDQDRGRWDYVLIRRGLEALQRAEQPGKEPGPYVLQAAIAACHAKARTPEETDWLEMTRLYEQLARLAPSPVVELNRAVAVGMAFGPKAGLDLVDTLLLEKSLKDYHLLPSVRGDFLWKLGRFQEAHDEFQRAATLARNSTERLLLLERAAASLRR